MQAWRSVRSRRPAGLVLLVTWFEKGMVGWFPIKFGLVHDRFPSKFGTGWSWFRNFLKEPLLIHKVRSGEMIMLITKHEKLHSYQTGAKSWKIGQWPAPMRRGWTMVWCNFCWCSPLGGLLVHHVLKWMVILFSTHISWKIHHLWKKKRVIQCWGIRILLVFPMQDGRQVTML